VGLVLLQHPPQCRQERELQCNWQQINASPFYTAFYLFHSSSYRLQSQTEYRGVSTPVPRAQLQLSFVLNYLTSQVRPNHKLGDDSASSDSTPFYSSLNLSLMSSSCWWSLLSLLSHLDTRQPRCGSSANGVRAWEIRRRPPRNSQWSTAIKATANSTVNEPPLESYYSAYLPLSGSQFSACRCYPGYWHVKRRLAGVATFRGVIAW
jgi:hypothetical protein